MGIHKDLQGFARLWRDSQGFTRISETLGEDLQDFGRGFMGIRKDSFWERICKTLGEDSWDLQGFMRLWERIHKDETLGERICKDLQDFERFHKSKTLGEDSQGFVRLWERFMICKTLGEDL